MLGRFKGVVGMIWELRVWAYGKPSATRKRKGLCFCRHVGKTYKTLIGNSSVWLYHKSC